MKLYLFADDGKAVGEISSNNGTVDIQADLDAIAELSEVNQLPLSLLKCCCIHYGKKESKSQVYHWLTGDDIYC